MARPGRDLTGVRFRNYVVIGASRRDYRGRTRWNVRCDCGHHREYDPRDLAKLAQREAFSCGGPNCTLPGTPWFADHTGKRFGWLTVVRFLKEMKRWECRCDCGATTRASASNLLRGHAKSCGCKKGEMIGVAHTTHGATREAADPKMRRLFNIWSGVKARCNNRNNRRYADYGGRGIRVCARWMKSFELFFADVGLPPSERHQLDRFPNNNGDYEPGNIRWASASENGLNKRNTRRLKFRGKSQPLAVWAKLFALSPDLVRARLKNGWSVSRALTTPLRAFSRCKVWVCHPCA